MAILMASILDANWDDIENEIKNVARAGVDGFSLDVMDGVFVPRTTFGPETVARIRRMTDLPLEVHLMVARPEEQIAAFCDAGADQILFHMEATEHAEEIIRRLHDRGVSAGVAVLVDTEVEDIPDELIRAADALNFMAVPIGYGGQKPSERTVEKIRAFRARCAGLNPDIAVEVDGGMKQHNCSACVDAGADLIVIGTGIYRAERYDEAVASAQANMRHDDPGSRRRLRRMLERRG